MKTKQIAFDAMLAAMCAALGYVSLDLGNLKFSFESFPILLASLLFGAVDGVIVAFLGTGIYQVLKYPVSATTVIWIIPYVLLALYTALLRKKNLYFVVISGGVLLTLLTTVSIYIDSVVWKYYSFAYVFGTLPLRLASGVIKSVVFVFIIKKIWNSIKKVLTNLQV